MSMQHRATFALRGIVALMSLGLAFGLVLSACSGNEPKTPQNEREKKLHENPSRAVFSLEAVTVGPDAFDANRHEIITTAIAEPKQEIEMRETKEGWKTTSEQKNFRVRSSDAKSNLAYIFRINYYSPSNQLMNHQFIQNGQDKIHQHFFHYYTTGTDPVRIKDPNKIPWLYRYCDTTPTIDGRKLYASDDNPIGFVGLMRFAPSDKRELVLTLELLHAYDSKFLKDGKPSPYYYMHPSKRGQGIDINIDIPIQIQE